MTDLRRDPEAWGRQVEVAVAAHLLNSTAGTDAKVTWWRERDREVDFVVQRGRSLLAIEVKSGARRRALTGMAAFCAGHLQARPLLVGGDGIGVEEFLTSNVGRWLES